MKSILVIEDDQGLRETFDLIFPPPEFEVTLYANGDFVWHGKYALPDVFIIDMQLSGASGLDICRFLKQNNKTAAIPVIMVSANPKINILARDAGADIGIEKPFSIAVLRQNVKNFLSVL